MCLKYEELTLKSYYSLSNKATRMVLRVSNESLLVPTSVNFINLFSA